MTHTSCPRISSLVSPEQTSCPRISSLASPAQIWDYIAPAVQMQVSADVRLKRTSQYSPAGGTPANIRRAARLAFRHQRMSQASAHVCAEKLSLALGTLPADPARRAALNERVASVASDAPIRRVSRNANEVRPPSNEVRPRSRSRNRRQR